MVSILVVAGVLLGLCACQASAAPVAGRAARARTSTAAVLTAKRAKKAKKANNSAADQTLKPWSQLHPLADPAAYKGPTTARIANANITPITNDPKPVLPVQVTDYQGTKVTVTSDSRILALDLYGTLSATVYGLGLGKDLVGRDQSTGFPAAAHLPVVTFGAHELSAEGILKLHPTVLITDTTLGPWDVVLQMRSSGIPVVVVSPKRTLGSTDTLVNQVAAALGVKKEGYELDARLTKQIGAEETQIKKIEPKKPADKLRILFLYVRGNAGVYYIFGKDSGADSLIDALGGVDVATEHNIDGFFPLTAEALAKCNPNVILMMTLGLQSVGGVKGALKLPGVAETQAGQDHRIVDMSDYQILSFGPLSAEVLDALARALYVPQTVKGPGPAINVPGVVR
jgi:iron complex transport system substrate-binding protein